MAKLSWSGTLQGVQPRIDLGRSFDQRFHSYLGYLLVVEGEVAGGARTFTVRIGPAAQARHAFRAGDIGTQGHVVHRRGLGRRRGDGASRRGRVDLSRTTLRRAIITTQLLRARLIAALARLHASRSRLIAPTIPSGAGK